MPGKLEMKKNGRIPTLWIQLAQIPLTVSLPDAAPLRVILPYTMGSACRKTKKVNEIEFVR
jgi:hypothetical protein